jgi:hypothetical protein
MKIGPSGFPGSGQYFCGRKFIWRPIYDTATTKFRRFRSLSTGASFGALLLSRATNAWAVGAFADDVSTLSTLSRVVRPMDTATDALPPWMVRAYSGFWPQRLLRRRWPLRIDQPPVGQKGLESEKPDSPECQAGPSSFPVSHCSSQSLARARSIKDCVLCRSVRGQPGANNSKD